VVGGLGDDEVPPTTMVDARPAALVEGRIVDWGELQPLLNEAAGGAVLAEVVLDLMLARELDDAGMLITAADVDAERALFYETMSEDPDVAVEVSTDTSAARGGLLEPISRADASYPQVMREALWALVPGELSRPVFLSDRYAVLSLVRVVDGDDADFHAVRPDLERMVRLNQERILMDDLARQLVAEASITIIDEEVKWSWDARQNR
jgi:parvulin-like peptidyl-prolyl isomerase